MRYKDTIDLIEKGKLNEISNFIMEGGGIEYRHLLNNPEVFKNIPPNQNKEKLDAELHKINYELEKKHKTEANTLLKKRNIENYEEYEQEIKELVKKEHEFSISKLANYVIRRKVIINVFTKLLELNQITNKYNLEKDLHNVIFPMGGDSDTIPYANHNLWLLDERLTFHTYVCSDKKISAMSTIDSTSAKEPDLTIFDKRWAFSTDNQFQSIMVFEFKKPGRILSGDDREVDNQVKEYFQELLKSKAKSYRGILLNIDENTPKFGYIICEIDKDLNEYLIKWGGFFSTPAGTLYKYMGAINLYIEVMTYQTMLKNAETRHISFFKQLGIEYF